MKHKHPALERAKKIAGGNTGLGRILGISSQAVSQWRQIPADRVLEVEQATGISRQELRPDIFLGAGERPKTTTSAPTIRPAEPSDRHFSRFAHLRRSHFASSDEIVQHVRALREEWDRR